MSNVITAAMVLAELLRPPIFYGDRGVPRERLEAAALPYAEAIAEGTNGNVALAAAEVELARAEGGGGGSPALYVLEGRCLDGRFKCDRDPRTGLPRARGPFQVWAWCKAAWALPAGESAREEEACARRHLLGARERCYEPGRDPWIGAFSGYRWTACSWEKAAQRARAKTMIEVRLRGTVLARESGGGARLGVAQ